MSMFNAIRSLNPYLFYAFDEGPGVSVVSDKSGNGRNGTNPSNAVGVRVAGPGSGIPHSYVFDGGDADYINTNVTTNFTSASTFCALIYPTSNPSDRDTIWSKNSYYATTNTDFPITLIRASNQQIAMSLDPGGDFSANTTINSGISAPLNTWTFVAGVYRANGECSVWQNDIKAASTTIGYTISTTSRNWVIGRESAPNGGGVNQSGFNGRITYPALWDRALTDNEMRSVARAWLWSGVRIAADVGYGA